jgi:lipoprotein-anchoring transpeptidase ErfK/SrfK
MIMLRRAAPAALFAALVMTLAAGCGSGPAAPRSPGTTAPATGAPGTGAPARRSPAPSANRTTPPVAAPTVPRALLARLPRATTFARLAGAPLDDGPSSVQPPADGGTLVAHLLSAQVVYAAPGGRPFAVLPATELGGPTWVPVVQTEPGWDRVLLPSRPDHATGWLVAGAALEIRYTAYVIRVSLGARRLTVLSDGQPLGAWTVAVGAPGTPTPVGRTFLLAQLAPPEPRYSPLILPLGTHSSTLDTFGGGPGTVALHGWPESSVFGHAVSHGCVRVPGAALRLLARVPLGTLVVITR